MFHDFALMSADGTQVAPSFYDLLAERGFPPVAALKGCSMAVTRAFVDAVQVGRADHGTGRVHDADGHLRAGKEAEAHRGAAGEPVAVLGEEQRR